MKFIPWLLLISLSMVGCSGSKSAQSVNQETPQIELSDADDFIENPNEEAIPLDMSSELSDMDAMAPVEPMAPSEPLVVEESAPLDMNPVLDLDQSPVVSENVGGSEKTYVVGKNETLMLIAFKLYGNYEKWKELANYNSAQLNGSTSVRQGMTLKYMAPAEEFVWNPEGLPYLIRTGDTLGGISTTVYNTSKKWKLIWNNNRPLIKDPHKIFAGFTIYYLENGREVASEI
jgi:nucleoid-associated protein YgaU